MNRTYTVTVILTGGDYRDLTGMTAATVASTVRTIDQIKESGDRTSRLVVQNPDLPFPKVSLYADHIAGYTVKEDR